jgi:hypothetical protein
VGAPDERVSATNGHGRRRLDWHFGTDVDLRPIRFVDKPLLQADAFILVVGRKGQGKGTFVAMNAAAVMRGELGPRT